MLSALLGMAWRSIAGAVIFSSGLIASRVLFHALGAGAPRMPNQAPENMAAYYLLAGSCVLAICLVPVTTGITGHVVVKCAALTTFLFLGFGVSSTAETAIYTSVDGVLRMIPILFLPCALLAGVHTALIKAPLARGEDGLPVGSWSRLEWILRCIAAVAVFPILYFVFGVLVSPVVTSYYESGVSGLLLPDVWEILRTESLRGVLHVLAVAPVLAIWSGSRRHLVLSLSVGFFVFVMAYDTVLAYQVPTKLILVHGVEVLAKSLIYGWVLVHLLHAAAAARDALSSHS